MELLNIDRTLSVMLTYRCNAECGDCGTLSNPRITGKLSDKELIAAINQAADIGFVNVVFTGGEATIYEELLLLGISTATQRGLRTRLVTNGVWAKNLHRAQEKLANWKNAGLMEVNLSTGDQHQRFVSESFIRNAIKAADKIGIYCLLMIEKYQNSSVCKETFLQDTEMYSLFKEDAFKILESPWMPLNPEETRMYSPGETATNKNLASFGGCDSVLQTYVIGTDPGIYSCCGIGARLINELQSKSKFDPEDAYSLEKIIFDAEQDFVKLWIRAEGTEKILSWCNEKDATIDWEGRYAHKCQACLRIYSDPKIKEMIQEYYDEKIPDVIFRELIGEGVEEFVNV